MTTSRESSSGRYNPPAPAPAVRRHGHAWVQVGCSTAGAPDFNAHMNVRFHFDHLCDAIQRELEALGINDEYRIRAGQSVFTVDHHLTYAAEILPQDVVSKWVRLDHWSDRTIHYTAALHNDSRSQLSSKMEAVLVNVDLLTRRSTPMTPQLCSHLARLSRRQDAMPAPWDPSAA